MIIVIFPVFSDQTDGRQRPHAGRRGTLGATRRGDHHLGTGSGSTYCPCITPANCTDHSLSHTDKPNLHLKQNRQSHPEQTRQKSFKEFLFELAVELVIYLLVGTCLNFTNNRTTARQFSDGTVRDKLWTYIQG